MCGACGSGLAVAPWETTLMADSNRTRRLIAAALDVASHTPRVRVTANPFGGGYLINSASGRRHLADDLDAAVDALGLSVTEPENDIELPDAEHERAHALVHLSRARAAGAAARTLTLRDREATLSARVSRDRITITASVTTDFRDVTNRTAGVSIT